MNHESRGQLDSLLKLKNYQKDPESNIWCRPEYFGIQYSDGDAVEKGLLEIITKANDKSVLSPQLRGNCNDWASIYHLSSSRANLLRPFRDKIRGSILEIGAGCGAITRYLGECGADVLALEGSPRRASIARARTSELENVTVISERFADFALDYKFDVITLIGVFEYANLFTPGDNPPLSMLKRVRSFLKPNGILLLAIENQLGLKYFAGAGEDHIGTPMFGIENRYTNASVRTFGHKELKDLLIAAGFRESDFMGCFPDYKLPSSIITQSGFVNPDFDASALASQSTAKDFLKPEYRCFSPELAWPKIIQNGLGLDLANSFLIAASQGDAGQISNEKILGYHYSSDRLPELSRETIFEISNGDEISVRSRSLQQGESALSSKIPLNNSTLIFNIEPSIPYSKGRVLSSDFVRVVTRPGWRQKELKEFFSNYLTILSKLAGKPVTLSLDDKVDGIFLDCIPNNIIEHSNGTHEFIDREWTLTSPISIRRLIFRALLKLIAMPSDYALDEQGRTYNYEEFFVQSFKILGSHVTVADLQGLLTEELQLQETVTGVQRDSKSIGEFFNYRLPHKKYPEVTPLYAQKLAELQAEIQAIKSSRKWRYAVKLSNMLPGFLKKIMRRATQET